MLEYKSFTKKILDIANIIQSTTEEAVGRQVERRLVEETIEETERRIKLQVIADRLGVSQDVAQAVENANIDENTLISFKKVPNAVAEVVGKLLGINPIKLKRTIIDENTGKKVKNPKFKANLTAGEVASAQRWFNKNAQLVIDGLPQGFDSEGKATGVPGTVLEALYNKRDSRAKTKAGLQTQVKRTNILDSELLELVDIIDGAPTRDRNTSARIIALADLLGKVMTNQQLRINNPALTRIADGMSPVMFNKDKNTGDKKGVKSDWPVIARIYNYDRLDVSTKQGREDMINWIKATGSQQMTFNFWKSVLQGSGGKYTKVTIDGKKVRRYDLIEGGTILETDPNFKSSQVNHVPSSKKHVFANVPQMKEAFEGIEFTQETDCFKSVISKKSLR